MYSIVIKLYIYSYTINYIARIGGSHFDSYLNTGLMDSHEIYGRRGLFIWIYNKS